MKNILIRLSVAVGLTLAVCALSSSGRQQPQQDPVLAASTNVQAPTFPQSSAPPDSQNSLSSFPSDQGSDQTQDVLAFTGRAQESKGVVLLMDPVTRLSYRLDNQSGIKQLLGRRIKVIGKLQMKTNTIQVERVELLP